MTDFLGNELSVGDSVVALAHQRTSSTLYLGKIVKLTAKMVVVNTINGEKDWRYDDVMRVSPTKVVKVNMAMQ